MATKTLWTDRVVTSVNPEVRSTVTCDYERIGTKLRISITTSNHMTDRTAWRYNRWAMNVSINGQEVVTNFQIKARTYGVSGTQVFTATTPYYTVDIGNSDRIPISIFYFDTGWGSSYNIVTRFNTLTEYLTGIPSLPTVSLSADYSYPHMTHNSLQVNYNVSGNYNYVRVWVDNREYGDFRSSPFTVSNLAPNSNHSIYARAYGNGGFGQNSNTLNFRTFVTPVSVSVGSVRVDNIEPFSCTAYCGSNDATNTSSYEFAICDTSPQRNVVRGAYTTKNTYYNFTGLSEESSYYLRVRVQTSGSGAWSDFIYILFSTPADVARGYVQTSDGRTHKGKTYFKNPDTHQYVKVKKVWVKVGGQWKKAKNIYD